MRLPELRTLFEKVTGKATRSPNKKFLIRTIVATLAARPKGGSRRGGGRNGGGRSGVPAAAMKTLAAETSSTPVATSPTHSAGAMRPRRSWANKTVQDLQDMYLAVVGRSTDSDDRGYLIWKIREAEKGQVRVGPRKLRDPKDIRTIPLCMDKTGVEMMDETWRATGFKSRNQFVNRAVGKLLTSLGADEAAAHFGGTAGASA